MELKQQLLNQCKKIVDNRLETIQQTISQNQNALQSETKSSAGDKHETGRAMLQLEIEKAGQLLHGVQQMLETLSKINADKKSKIAHLGSLVETKESTYFLSISVGKILVDNKTYFAVSVSSPIGKLLLGKKENEKVMFNGKTITILKIT